MPSQVTNMSNSQDHSPDTGQQAIAAVYAKALLAAAEKSGTAQSLLDELGSLVQDVLKQQPKFAAALASPRIATEEKLGLLDNVFSGRVSPELLRFLKVVARHERLGALAEISREYRKQYNEKHQRVEAVVTTAEPLPDDLRDSVLQSLQAKLGQQVDLVLRTDADLLAGMVVRVGDTVYDASLANRLDRQRRQTIRRSVARLQQTT